MKRDETLHQAIEGLLARTDTHPDADELVAYHEGTLRAADAQRIQDHLVACRECAALVADLERLGDPEFGADEDIPEEHGRARVEERSGSRSAGTNDVPFRRPRCRGGSSPWPRCW